MSTDVVNKLWGFCHTLRHDGIDYGDYIEQITYLLFLRRLDDLQTLEEKKSRVTGQPITQAFFAGNEQHLRWGQFKQLEPGAMFDVVGLEVFPYLRDGELVNVKYRNIAEKKDMRQEGGAEPCLFGWHLIDPKARAVAICEGEIDAMTLHQSGVQIGRAHV